MSILLELLAKAVQSGASDIHIKTGQVPFFRINGHLQESGFENITPESAIVMIKDLVPQHLASQLETEHEVDFSHHEEGVGRFRVNIFQSQGLPCLAMRYVKNNIPSIEQLRLPSRIKEFAKAQRGILLASGTTGSGKSTTLAAILSEINRTERRRIITVEDPIEYVFEDDLSLISQREVGLDTMSFQNALKYLMRQDPEVILIGEMRDRTSIRTALLAAETGHLVMSTLHAGTAQQAVPRILDMFPADEQDQIRLGLAANLVGIVCQRLMRDVEGNLIPAAEILINTPTVHKLLVLNNLETISAAIEVGRDEGMQSFNQSIYDMIQDGFVTEDEGMDHATNPESLRMNLQGIFLDESRRILAT
ncbi:MAG: PilT/PilU family type 4a pilus ATPase [Verrucomicrobia bacterium]|nr:PilT/PilU family type 4a pilus ATPase [Verrucomicrobiota bacterium]